MNRRKFISACGIAGLSTVSGCVGGEAESTASSSDEESSTQETFASEFDPDLKTDRPALELLAIQIDPEPVVYSDEFTILATVANVGREPIEGTGTAATAEMVLNYTETDREFPKRRQWESEDIELPSGAVTTIPIGPLTAAAAGTWNMNADRFMTFVRDGVETQVEVLPQSVSIGEPVHRFDDSAFTFERIEVRNSFHYKYEPFSTFEVEPPAYRSERSE